MGGGTFLAMVPDKFFSGLNLFPFLAMPFFILAGEIMNRSGLTLNLVNFAQSLVGWLRGGMAHSNMLASVLFAGLTGSATADAAAFGNTLVPAMKKAGYSGPYACAVTAAGSIIGPIIPPSTLGHHLRVADGGLHRRPVCCRYHPRTAAVPCLHVPDRCHSASPQPAQGPAGP